MWRSYFQESCWHRQWWKVNLWRVCISYASCGHGKRWSSASSKTASRFGAAIIQVEQPVWTFLYTHTNIQVRSGEYCPLETQIVYDSATCMQPFGWVNLLSISHRFFIIFRRIRSGSVPAGGVVSPPSQSAQVPVAAVPAAAGLGKKCKQ